VQQDVLGLEVAVDEALQVQVLQRQQHLRAPGRASGSLPQRHSLTASRAAPGGWTQLDDRRIQ